MLENHPCAPCSEFKSKMSNKKYIPPTFDQPKKQEVDELLKIKKTQLKMLHKRGYDISREKKILSVSSDVFYRTYYKYAQQSNISIRTVLSQVYLSKEKETYLAVIYVEPVEKKVNIDQFCEAFNYVNATNTGAKDVIFITSKPFNNKTLKCIDKLLNYNITVFEEHELKYDPTEHFLVPEHKILNASEADFFFKNNPQIDIATLPYIKSDDAIIKYLGGKPGQIVEIDRIELLPVVTEKYKFYQLIIEPNKSARQPDITDNDDDNTQNLGTYKGDFGDFKGFEQGEL